MPSLSPTGPEIPVNTVTAGDQTPGGLAVLANGVQAMAWLDAGIAKLRLFDAVGRPLSAEAGLGAASDVEVTGLRDGGFAVSRIERAGDTIAVHARTYDASGLAKGPDIIVASYASSLARTYEALGLHAEALTHGGFALTWATASHDSFFIRGVDRNLAVIDASGSLVSQLSSGLNQPSKALASYDPGVQAVELADGRLLVTWWVKPTATELGGQRVQLHDVDGRPLTDALPLDRGFPLDGGARAEGPGLDAAVLAGGHVVFAWSTGGNIVYSIYSPTGLGEHVIDDRTAPRIAGAGTGAPQIAVLADGRFAIAWTGPGETPDAMARLFTTGGAPESEAFHLGDVSAGPQDLPLLAALGGGGLATAWRGPDDEGLGVKLQILAPNTPPGPVVHIGGAAADALAGGSGEDWLYGQGGADTLSGGFGADTFILREGGGADRVLDFVRGVDHLQLFDTAGRLVDGSRGLLILDAATHTLSWDPDSDIGPAAPQAIALLDGISQISRADFAAGLQPSALRIVEAGGREETVFDWGQATWDRTVADFNGVGAVISYQVVYDDGSSTTTWFDDRATQTWATRWASYDPSGALTGYQVALDDGRHTMWSFDPQNRELWSRAVDDYDAQGRLLSRGWAYDDGMAKVATFDVDGRQPWTMQVEVYAASGQRTALWTYMDDGSFVG